MKFVGVELSECDIRECTGMRIGLRALSPLVGNRGVCLSSIDSVERDARSEIAIPSR